MLTFLHDLVFDYTLRNVTLGSAILGIVGGVLGTFAVLRKQGLMGDALAHSALPGICLAFMLSGSRAPVVLMLGAAISGWLGTLLILRILRDTRVSEDTALGVVLTVFFGLGIVLLTQIQHSNNASQAGLDRYLFGQAATLMQDDVRSMAIVGGVGLLVVAVLFKELKLLAFDAEFATTLGYPTQRLNILLTSSIVLAVVVGLQTVGVVLMAAMLVAPGVAARQWTNRLGVMVFLSGAFGAMAGISGALFSVTARQIPTGPMIVLCATVLVVISLLFAPERGIIWDSRRRRSLGNATLAVEKRSMS